MLRFPSPTIPFVCLWLLGGTVLAQQTAQSRPVKADRDRVEITCKPTKMLVRKVKHEIGTVLPHYARTQVITLPIVELTLHDGERAYVASAFLQGFKLDPKQSYTFALLKRAGKDHWEIERITQEGKQLYPPTLHDIRDSLILH